MIVTYDQLPEIREKYKEQRIVFGGGVYDLLHCGHTEGLTFRKSLGEILICGVVSDERAESRKRRPVRDEKDRLMVMNAFRDVDYVFIMPLSTSKDSPTLQVIKSLRPDIYVEHIENAYRWTDKDQAYICSLGTEFIFDIQPKSNSTTEIINRLKS
jgi:cytidyltransferase-like protein